MLPFASVLVAAVSAVPPAAIVIDLPLTVNVSPATKLPPVAPVSAAADARVPVAAPVTVAAVSGGNRLSAVAPVMAAEVPVDFAE